MGYWNPIRKVFLIWAVIVLVGFVFTYLSAALGPSTINLAWIVLAGIGFVYSKKQMPFSVPAFRNIFIAWSIIIVVGIAYSQALFTIPALLTYSAYIGAIWIVLMALGHAITGIIDKKKLYIITALIQLIAAVAVVVLMPSMPVLYMAQYLVAGVVGAAAMVLLILYA